MIPSHDMMTDSSERPLRLRVRSDLVVDQQTYLGRNYWIVKDPLTLTFYRFEAEEYSILRMIDGRTSPAEIQRRFARQYAPQRLALAELQSFASRLFQSSLVVADAAAQGEQLLARQRQRRHRQRHETWSNILCIRFGGINPDRLLQWLNRWCGWILSWPSLVASLLLICSALLLVAAEFDVFLERLPGFHTFFAAENWLLLALVMAGTKVLHELGHGLACRRLGGECHEMGLMLLLLTPCLYCNVSDSWMVRGKWRRAAIGAAGMYVELVLAGVCTFLWWLSDVGLLHYLCLDVMFVCSVSTLLFNANPLLRYDGYFILSDLLEIPNLRQKSTAAVQGKLSGWFLGLTPRPDPFLPSRRRWLFMLYAVAASVYRWVVVASILWFLYTVFEPQGLKVVGQLLVVVSLYGLLLAPLWQLARFLRVPGRVRQLKKLRMTAVLLLLAALATAILMTPWPYCVTCDFHIQPRGATPAYVDVPGTLLEIHVQEGQFVREGQSLAVLGNADIDLAILRLVGEREQLVSKLAALQLQAYDNDTALLETAEVSQSIESLDRRIQRRRQDRQHLAIRAPCDGYVFPAPLIAPSESPETLPAWSGHPLQNENLMAYLQEGVAVCRIGDAGQLEAILAVDEAAIQSLAAGQTVELFPAQWRGGRLTGYIAQISHADLRVTPASYSAARETLPRDNHQSGSAPRRPSNTYQANVPLELTNATLLAGGTGRARIDAGSRTLASRLWNSFCRTFHCEL